MSKVIKYVKDKEKSFEFNGINIRVLIIGKVVWFNLNDIGKALGVQKARQLADTCEPDEKGAFFFGSLGGRQEMLAVTESGLNRIMMRSNKPAAKPFQDWLAKDVLPSIRRTGQYSNRLTKWLPVDRSAPWPELRADTKEENLDFNKTLKRAKVNDDMSYRVLNNDCLRVVTGHTAMSFKEENGLHPNASVQDNLSKKQLFALAYVKMKSAEFISRTGAQGKGQCRKVISRVGKHFKAYEAALEAEFEA